MITTFRFLPIAAVLLTACSPKPIISMRGDENQSHEWNYGKQILINRSGDFEARVFFDTYTKNHLIFDVEIVNLGGDTILVSPEKFYLTANTGATIHQRNSKDPEEEILNSKIKQSRREASERTAALIAGTAAVAGVVALAASDDKGQNNSDEEDTDNNETHLTIIDVNPVVPVPEVNVLPPDILFWEDYSLRKTTLAPGYKVRGKVVFERIDEARNITLHFPVGPSEMKVNLVQQLIKP